MHSIYFCLALNMITAANVGVMIIQESLSVDVIENKKCCTVCKTTKTPLWRGGPAGPKVIFPTSITFLPGWVFWFWVVGFFLVFDLFSHYFCVSLISPFWVFDFDSYGSLVFLVTSIPITLVIDCTIFFFFLSWNMFDLIFWFGSMGPPTVSHLKNKKIYTCYFNIFKVNHYSHVILLWLLFWVYAFDLKCF